MPVDVGSRVYVRASSGSKCLYEGREAIVVSLHNTKCKLRLEDDGAIPRGTVTGFVNRRWCFIVENAQHQPVLPLDPEPIPEPLPPEPFLPPPNPVLQVGMPVPDWQIGMHVLVAIGSYAGRMGRIVSVHPQSCRLEMDASGRVTGYLRHAVLRRVVGVPPLAAEPQPPAEPEPQEPRPPPEPQEPQQSPEVEPDPQEPQQSPEAEPDPQPQPQPSLPDLVLQLPERQPSEYIFEPIEGFGPSLRSTARHPIRAGSRQQLPDETPAVTQAESEPARILLKGFRIADADVATQMTRELALLCTELREQPSVLWPKGFFRLDDVVYLEYPMLSASVASRACLNLYEYMQARRRDLLPDPAAAETWPEKIAMQVHLATEVDQLERALCRQVLFSLKLLHGAGFVHGNVKPQNFLISDALPAAGATSDSVKVPLVVLSDFVSMGAEPPPSPALAAKTRHGTPPSVERHSSVADELRETGDFAAPEVRQGEPPRRPSDVWSAGMVLFECIHGTELANKHRTDLDAVCVGLPEGVPRTGDAFDALITGMMQSEPAARLAAAACFSHTFFTHAGGAAQAKLDGLDFDSPAKLAELEGNDGWQTRAQGGDRVTVPPGQQLPIALELLERILVDPDCLRNRWAISNTGQEGQDAGGLLSEFHLDVWAHLVQGKPEANHSSFFEPEGGDVSLCVKDEDIEISKDEHLQVMRKAGALVVKTLFDKRRVSPSLGGVVFKYLSTGRAAPVDLGDDGNGAAGVVAAASVPHLSMADLAEFNPTLAGWFTALLALPAANWARYDDYVAVTGREPVGGRPTDETKAEFVRRELQWLLVESRRESLEAMREGFLTAKLGLDREDQRKLGALSHRELRYVAQGDIRPTAQMVLRICNFERLEDEGGAWLERAAWLRQLIRDLSEEQVRQLLRFTLNIESAPLPAQQIKVKLCTHISRGDGTSREATCSDLPFSHSCFGALDLPPYTSKEQLTEKVLMAIPHGHGHHGGA